MPKVNERGVGGFYSFNFLRTYYKALYPSLSLCSEEHWWPVDVFRMTTAIEKHACCLHWLHYTTILFWFYASQLLQIPTTTEGWCKGNIHWLSRRLQRDEFAHRLYIGTDTGSVEQFFNIFTTRIKIFVITWEPSFKTCVVEVCRLGLKPLWHSSQSLCRSENADAGWKRTSWGATKDENHWARGPG